MRAMTGPRFERDPLVALRSGDPLPFEAFVRAWTRKLVAYFHHQGASTSRAEDLAQEVFLRLYRSAARYRPRERFSAYCYRAARNLWIDECRRTTARADGSRARSEERVPLESLGVHVAPDKALLVAEEDGNLQRLLGELPSGQRAVFELTYPEIGALLEIPVGTVKSRMFHAVRRLRSAWREKLQREGVA